MAGTKNSGRPKTIPALRVLTGTHRVDRHGKEKDVEVIKFQAPTGENMAPISETPPDWLDPDAQRHWMRLHGALVEYGFVDRLDTTLVGELCALSADLERSHRILNRMVRDDPDHNALLVSSATGPRLNPIRKEMRNLRREVMQISVVLGLTPLIRQRLMMMDDGALDDPQTKKFFGG